MFYEPIKFAKREGPDTLFSFFKKDFMYICIYILLSRELVLGYL